MKVFNIKSNYECLIKDGDEESILSANETLQIEGFKKLLVYPLSTNRRVLPFSIDTNFLSNCSFYNFAELDDDTTLICLAKQDVCESYSVTKLKIDGKDCIFEVGENKVMVSHNNWKKVLHLSQKFDRYNIQHKDDIVYIKLTSPSIQQVYAFNIQSGKTRAFSGDIITTNKQGFIVENENKKSTYSITAEGLRLDNVKSEHNAENNSLVDETIAYQFLNALKQGNAEFAYSLCSEKLQNNISKESLKNYFGEIANFFYITPYKYAVQTTKELNVYSFNILNKKIVDIEN